MSASSTEQTCTSGKVRYEREADIPNNILCESLGRAGQAGDTILSLDSRND